MDKKILEAIYDGEIFAAENIVPENSEYSKIRMKAGDEKEYFINTLPPEESERFVEMCTLIDEYSSLYNYAAFSYGFRLGVNLLVETLTNTGDLSRNN